MKHMMTIVLAFAGVLCAQAQSRDNFLLQQTQQEMQRVGGQVDALQNNVEDLQRRVGRLEGGREGASLRAEIDSLKQAIAEIRRELSNQRGEIVRDLSGRISKIQQAQAPAPQPPKTVTKTIGPHREYTVQAGDTLSLIAETFNTSVSKIREMNNLKGNNLRVGQKLNLPLK